MIKRSWRDTYSGGYLKAADLPRKGSVSRSSRSTSESFAKARKPKLVAELKELEVDGCSTPPIASCSKRSSGRKIPTIGAERSNSTTTDPFAVRTARKEVFAFGQLAVRPRSDRRVERTRSCPTKRTTKTWTISTTRTSRSVTPSGPRDLSRGPRSFSTEVVIPCHRNIIPQHARPRTATVRPACAYCPSTSAERSVHTQPCCPTKNEAGKPSWAPLKNRLPEQKRNGRDVSRHCTSRCRHHRRRCVGRTRDHRCGRPRRRGLSSKNLSTAKHLGCYSVYLRWNRRAKAEAAISMCSLAVLVGVSH